MATRYICRCCQREKREKTQAKLERSLQSIDARLRSLLFKCVDHRNDVVHEEMHYDEAKRLYDAVQAATNAVVGFLTAKRCVKCNRGISDPQIEGDERCLRCADPSAAIKAAN